MAELPRASHRTRTLVTALAPVIITLALMLGGAPVALAQDATTTTPPELRDFRLDPPTAERELPLPETPPSVTPAPSPEPAPTRPSPAPLVMPRRASDSPRTQASPSTRAPSAAAPASTETQQAPAPVPPAEPLPAPATPPNTPAAPVEKPFAANDDVMRIGGMIMLLVLAIAGGFDGYRRRAKAATASRPRNAIATPARQPRTSLSPSIPTAEPATLPAQSPLSMTFVPDNAVVSLANLVVRGQLQIVNEGPAVIHGATLRAALIAASTQQQQAIESFFADHHRIPPSAVGAINPGERIGLMLELSVALHDMQTFTLGDKILLVPILLAHLSHDNAAPQREAQLVTMIGREANPPTQKMGPLRLDLGPRSFDQLGQRPLLA